MNTQSLYVLTDSESHETLRVALLSDLHVKNSPDAIADLAELWSEVIEQTPDIVLLGGDYINDGASNQDIASIGPAIAHIFRASGDIPVVAVLGNHDHWSGTESWTEYLSEAGVIVPRPATMPVTIPRTEGLPCLVHSMIIQASEPAAADI